MAPIFLSDCVVWQSKYDALQAQTQQLQVSAQGFGDANPVASNDTAQGRAQNRRVELTLAGPRS